MHGVPFVPLGMWLNNARFVLWVFERGTLIKDITLYLTVLVVVLHHIIHDCNTVLYVV